MKVSLSWLSAYTPIKMDPAELAEMLATPQDGPRFLEVQVR